MASATDDYRERPGKAQLGSGEVMSMRHHYRVSASNEANVLKIDEEKESHIHRAMIN